MLDLLGVFSRWECQSAASAMQKACKTKQAQYNAAKLCWPILGKRRYLRCFTKHADSPTEVFRVSRRIARAVVPVVCVCCAALCFCVCLFLCVCLCVFARMCRVCFISPFLFFFWTYQINRLPLDYRTRQQ